MLRNSIDNILRFTWRYCSDVPPKHARAIEKIVHVCSRASTALSPESTRWPSLDIVHFPPSVYKHIIFMWTSDGNEYFDILSNMPKWEGLRSFHWCIYQRLSFSGLYGSAENTLLKTENYTILCAPFSRQIHDRCSRDFHVTGTLVHKSQNGKAACVTLDFLIPRLQPPSSHALEQSLFNCLYEKMYRKHALIQEKYS